MKFKKLYSRKKFESNIYGNWIEMSGGRYRKNGQFETSLQKDQFGQVWKIFKMKDVAFRAKSWDELAEMLKFDKLNEMD